MDILPQEELCVIHPLVDELRCDWLWAVREADVVQCVQQEGGTVVESSDGHLQTHGPQLTGLHSPRQALQNGLHKQGDALGNTTHRHPHTHTHTH